MASCASTLNPDCRQNAIFYNVCQALPLQPPPKKFFKIYSKLLCNVIRETQVVILPPSFDGCTPMY